MSIISISIFYKLIAFPNIVLRCKLHRDPILMVNKHAGERDKVAQATVWMVNKWCNVFAQMSHI